MVTRRAVLAPAQTLIVAALPWAVSLAGAGVGYAGAVLPMRKNGIAE